MDVEDVRVIPLKAKGPQQINRMAAVQHVIAAVLLLQAAYGLFPATSAPKFFLAGFQAITGVLLLWAVVREIRGAPSSPTWSRMSWLDLAAGLALLVGWAVSLANGGQFFDPALVTGVISMGLTFFQVNLHRRSGRRNRRRLRLDSDGLSFRFSLLHRFAARWADLAWVAVASQAPFEELHLGYRSGREHRVRLDRWENAQEVSEALLEASRQAKVEIRPLPQDQLVPLAT